MNQKPIGLLFLGISMIIFGQIGFFKSLLSISNNYISISFYLIISLSLILSGAGIFIKQNWGRILLLLSSGVGLIICTFLITIGINILYSDHNISLFKSYIEDKTALYSDFMLKFNAFKAFMIGLVFGVFFSILIRLFLNKYKSFYQNFIEEK